MQFAFRSVVMKPALALALALLVCEVSTVYAKTVMCSPPNIGSSLSYTVADTPQHNSNGHATILRDSLAVPGCCGVVTGWQLSVQGDSSYSAACQSGCDIDFIVWTDFVSDTVTPGYYQATIVGINSETVYTDAAWSDGTSAILQTITIPLSQQIPLAYRPSNEYYIGWNCYTQQAIDYIEDTYSFYDSAPTNGACSSQGASCFDWNYIYTTEYTINQGFDPATLASGITCHNFNYLVNVSDVNAITVSDRFYAFNAIVDSGNPPNFLDAKYTTKYVLSTTPIGSTIYSATAENDETLETLTYSIVSETPSGSTYFTIDSATGEISTIQSLSTFIGTRTLSLKVSDGCQSATTVVKIVIDDPTTTAEQTTTPVQTTTSEATTTSMETTSAAVTTTPVVTTTSAATTTPSITTAADTTTTMETTTSAATTTPSTTTGADTTTTVETTTSAATTTPSITTAADTTTSVETTTSAATTTSSTTATVTTTLGVTTPAVTTIKNTQTTAAAVTTAAVTTSTTVSTAAATSTTPTTTTTTTSTTTGPTTTPGLLDTTSGKAIVAVAAILGAAALATLIGLCLVLNKSAAGSASGISPMVNEHGHIIKMKVKPKRYLDSERKAWEWK